MNSLANIDTTKAKPITIEHRLRIIQDDCDINPREEFDHIATMFCEHRRYTLGDKKADDIRVENERTGELEFPDGYLVLPLYLYDHSGLTISTGAFSCRWDSGQVGYIYMSKKDAIANFGKKRLTKKVIARALDCMRAEVKEYDDYLTGNVYGFEYEQVAVNADGEEQMLEEDSCWGFFGYDPECNGIADHLPVNLADCIVTRE